MKRRTLLAAAGVTAGLAALDPVRSLVNSILRGILSRGWSAAGGSDIPPRNYLKIHPYGGPIRYLFDSPLRPSDRDAFVANRHIFNRLETYDNDHPYDFKGAYETVKVSGINMPYLWNFDFPSAAGGFRRLGDLAPNMLMIRGADMGSDGHPGNSAKLVAPIPGMPSLTGLVAERSRAPIPSISLGRSPASQAYLSAMGTGTLEIPFEHPNYAGFLVDAFTKDQASFRDQKNLDDAVSEALAALENDAAADTNSAGAVGQERRRADRLMRRGVADLADAYPALVQKYETLIARSTALAIPGVTDRELRAPSLPLTVSGQRDLLEIFGPFAYDHKFLCRSDIVAPLRRAKIAHLAQQFAIAEFALLEGLSSSVVVSPPWDMGDIFAKVDLENLIDRAQIHAEFDGPNARTGFRPLSAPVSAQKNFPLDSHGFGSVPNLIAHTIYFQALGACLLEITDRLKSKTVEGRNLFDETIVHLSSEFDRLPSKFGDDSHHNYRAQATSIYSGIIKGPIVLGNVLVGTPGGYGTAGMAGPVKDLGGRPVEIANISSTISELTRVPRIVDRARSLVAVDGDRVTPAIEHGRNVEGENTEDIFA